jgi:hypothetical protein
MQSIVANCNAVVVALYGQAGPTFKEFSLLILPRFKEINQNKSYFSSGPSYLISYSFPETAVGGEIGGILVSLLSNPFQTLLSTFKSIPNFPGIS